MGESGTQSAKSEWPIISFREVSSNDTELLDAQSLNNIVLNGSIYRIEMYHSGTIKEIQQTIRRYW